MIKTKTFTETITYYHFPVGTKVCAKPECAYLEPNQVYTVVEMHEPCYAGDEALLFVDGVKHGILPRHVTDSIEWLKKVVIL